MHTRSSTIIAGGVAVAVLGALLVFAYARSVEGRTRPSPTEAAYVATEDLAAGTKWEDAARSMRLEQVPTTLRPGNAVSDDQQPAGRTSVRAISRGEVLTSTQFGAASGAPAGGLEIPPGHNGVVVNFPVPHGGGRYAQPGDIVNIYVTFKGGTNDGQPTTKLLLSNIQVLQNRAAGTSEPGQSGGEVLLTLALTPDAAERVIFAKENGSMWIGLVRPGDDIAGTAGHTFQSVLG